MALNILDYIILTVIALSVITGLFRGFVKEFIALLVWIFGLWIAFTYSSTLGNFLAPYIQDKVARYVCAFIVILFASVIVGSLFNAMLGFILRRSGLGGTDRLLGMAFGFFRGVFILAMIFLVVKISDPELLSGYTTSSRFYPKFEPLVNWLYGYVPDMIHKVKGLEPKELKTTLNINASDTYIDTP